jgi:nucleoside-diphosphate-sugar epimerase
MTTRTGQLVCTGAAGFLGSEVIRQAVVQGLVVRGVVRGAPPPIEGVTFFRGDVRDPPALRAAFAGARTVVHAAALAHVFDRRRSDAALFRTVNEIGTANVVRAAVESGATHVVLVSSVAVYGGGRDVDERVRCRPAGPYAMSKWQAEQRALEIAGAAGVPLTVLRLATVYGEGDRGNVARLVRALDRGRFVWIGDGSNRKSLIHREDAAGALLLAATRSSTGAQIYNVAAAPCSMREVVDALSAALGRRPPPRAMPAWAARVLADAALRITGGRGPVGTLGTAVTKWLSDDAYDGSRFAAEFGFSPHVGLLEGLRREVAWYRRENGRARARRNARE